MYKIHILSSKFHSQKVWYNFGQNIFAVTQMEESAIRHYYMKENNVFVSNTATDLHDKKMHGKIVSSPEGIELHLTISNPSKLDFYMTGIIEKDQDYITSLNKFKEITVKIFHNRKLHDINNLGAWIEDETD